MIKLFIIFQLLLIGPITQASCIEDWKRIISRDTSLVEDYSTIQRLRRGRASDNTALTQQTRRYIVHIDNLLVLNDVEAAKAELDLLFYKVESAYYFLNEFIRLKSLNFSEHAAFFDEGIKKYQDTFAKHISEYISIRDHLEIIKQSEKCEGETCQGAALELMHQLGLRSRRHQTAFNQEILATNREFPTGVVGRVVQYTPSETSIPSLVNLIEYFEVNPELLSIALRYEKIRERSAYLWDFFSEPVIAKTIFDMIQKIPLVGAIQNQELISLVFKELLDVRARIRHFPNITYLIRNVPDDTIAYQSVRNFTAEDPDFLVTFARRVDAEDLWARIKEQARTRPAASHFLARMNELEEATSIARQLGEISLRPVYNPTRNMIRFMIQVSIGLSGAYAVSHHKEILEKMREFYEISNEGEISVDNEELDQLLDDLVKLSP